MLEFEKILCSEIDTTETRLFEYAAMIFDLPLDKEDVISTQDFIYRLALKGISEESTPAGVLHKLPISHLVSGLDAIGTARAVLSRREAVTGGACKAAFLAALRSLMKATEDIGCIETLTGYRFGSIKDRLADISKTKSAINAVSGRDDQILKPEWLKHCRKALEEGRKIEQLNDLLDLQGYDPRLTKISAVTLKKWARESGIRFKAGRKKLT